MLIKVSVLKAPLKKSYLFVLPYEILKSNCPICILNKVKEKFDCYPHGLLMSAMKETKLLKIFVLHSSVHPTTFFFPKKRLLVMYVKI